MKKVLILFGKSNWRKSRPFDNKDYQYSYEFFYSLCKKSGIQMYRASYQWYDYKKHLFKYAWIYEGKNANWKRVRNIKPDLIYDKTKARMEVYYKKELIGEKYRFINNLEFTQLIDNKLTISLLFEKWSKKSWLVGNKKDLTEALTKTRTNKIVIKPLLESGGKDVWIINKKDALKKIRIHQPCLAQEFIDSSAGVPDFSKGTHDLRLVFINNRLIYAYTREPAKGKLLTNLAQGGSLTIIPAKKIPRSVLPVMKYANRIFETFSPRIFSIDLMFDRGKRPWVVELNSMPGLYFTPTEKPYMLRMYKKLLEIFKRELNVL